MILITFKNIKLFYFRDPMTNFLSKFQGKSNGNLLPHGMEYLHTNTIYLYVSETGSVRQQCDQQAVFWLLEKLFNTMQVHKEEIKADTVHSLQKPIKKFNISMSSLFRFYGEGGILEEEICWSLVKVIEYFLGLAFSLISIYVFSKQC